MEFVRRTLKQVVNWKGGFDSLSLYQGKLSLSSMAESNNRQANQGIQRLGVLVVVTVDRTKPLHTISGDACLKMTIPAGYRTSGGLRCPISLYSYNTLPLLSRFVRHVNHKSTNGYAEFRTEANASVRRNRRNAGCPGRCLRQQRAKRARVPLQRRVRVPLEDGRDHRFLWCVPTILFFFF
jgi:hypothetical protein